MNRTTLIVGAAVVGVISGAFVIFTSLQNRTPSGDNTLELTERELRLPPVIGDSTALLLGLKWRVYNPWPQHPRAPIWMDATKLTQLGFNCRVPLSDPHAREHYRAMPTALVFVALELEANKPTRAEGASSRHGPDSDSRLVVVDAMLDPRPLTSPSSGEARRVLTRALVSVHLVDRNENGELLAPPRLLGVIQELLPGEVFVPKFGSATLQRLRRSFDTPDAEEDHREPRFAATVHWGRRFEPWLTEVRLLTSGQPDAPR